MKKHYDVGIYGWWGHENFGGCLTYFALERAIRKLGYSVLMIQEANGLPNRYKIPNNGIAMSFANKYYDCSPQLDARELSQFNDKCDKFIIGGDQMWNNFIPFVNKDNFLNFVDNDKLKISYSTSFGTKSHNPSEEYLSIMRPLLKRFDHVGVREDYAVDTARKLYGVEATQVIDAVFLLDKSEYLKVAEQANVKLPSKYLLAYILNPTLAKRREIEIIAEKLNLDIVCVPDAASGLHEKFKEVFNGMRILDPLSVENLLKAYSEASYVVTDSFHGTCMSYIFKKDFSTYFNESRGKDRFVSLMKVLKLDSRRIYENQTAEEINNNRNIDFNVDWTVADESVSHEREFSLNWLSNALKEKKVAVTSKLKQELCVGCSACVNICPTGALSLTPDEYGYYRSTIKSDKCINCGLCAKICPALELPHNDNLNNPTLFEFQTSNESILLDSSSGGIFSLLAKTVLQNKGIVIGAAWKNDFTVAHIIVDNEKDLYKLRKSKYIQSYLGTVFKFIKEQLDKKVNVLFSGCPCQVAGLKSFLNKDYYNLITVDILCSHVPSPMFFRKYIEDVFADDVKQYEFRNKSQGWDCTCIAVTHKNGEQTVLHGVHEDSFQRVFHNHTMCPTHCEQCRYQSIPRFGDITIGDFWGINAHDAFVDANKGVSAVLINNKKGKNLFDEIPKSDITVKKEVPLNWLGGNGYALNGGHNFASSKRDIFYKAIKSMPFSKAVNYALKPNHGIYIEQGALNYSVKSTHFHFDPTVWGEYYLDNSILLKTKIPYSKPGYFATLPLTKPLIRGHKYTLKMKFKIKTDAGKYNFHIKDSGSNIYQVIYSHTVKYDDRNNWVEISNSFIPNSDIYDEFMLGAGQLWGNESWLAFDYIYIV